MLVMEKWMVVNMLEIPYTLVPSSANDELTFLSTLNF